MKQQVFTNEFRHEAIKLMEQGKSTIVQIAKDLGASDSTLHNWRNQLGTNPDSSKISPDEHEELIRLRRENKILKEEREILESRSILCEKAVLKYAFISAHKEEFKIKTMCRVLDVSRSGYHDWVHRGRSCCEIEDSRLLE